MARTRTTSYRRRRGIEKRLVAGAQMTAIFGVLISANAYVFFWRKRTSLPELQRRADGDRRGVLPSAAIGAEPASTAARPKNPPLPSGAPRWLTLDGDGRTIGERLADAGLPPAALPVALLEDKERGSTTVHVGLGTDGQIVALDLVAKNGDCAYYRRDGKQWSELAEQRRQKLRRVALTGSVGSSLPDALVRLPAHDRLAPAAATLLGGDLDFDDKTDRTDGKNRVRVLADRLDINGQLYRYGKVRALEWQSERRGLQRAFEFPIGSGRYYTERGDAAQRRWLRTPVQPLLDGTTRRVERSDRGEWRAPVGSAVQAMSEGRVVFVSKTAKGASITINHEDLSITVRGAFRPLPTIRVGSTVERGQTLGELSGPASTFASVAVDLLVAGKRVDATALPPRLPACPAELRPQLGEHVARAVKELLATDERLATASP